ncbi:hypothetical protein SLEP1_g57990 [Rubroshorea leprosula]|uniref:Uncharacterized protein n=1 Tax=Rubroshorea leprosula TaxID=152421 RepID=A0AAV5MRW2_9ROSI|nr:hypothetical protein SLEP1_g57990 [Rubroshorea leprosula]
MPTWIQQKGQTCFFSRQRNWIAKVPLTGSGGTWILF